MLSLELQDYEKARWTWPLSTREPPLTLRHVKMLNMSITASINAWWSLVWELGGPNLQSLVPHIVLVMTQRPCSSVQHAVRLFSFACCQTEEGKCFPVCCRTLSLEVFPILGNIRKGGEAKAQSCCSSTVISDPDVNKVHSERQLLRWCKSRLTPEFKHDTSTGYNKMQTKRCVQVCLCFLYLFKDTVVQFSADF